MSAGVGAGPAGHLPFAIDPTRSWAALERRLAETADARHRGMLDAVIAHLKAEAALDLAGLLASVAPDPRYHLWHGGVDRGPKGVDELTAFYTQLIEDRRGVFEFDIERIVVDDATVVTEGTFYTCYGGDLARRIGFSVDGEGPYLCPIRSVFLWPFDDEGNLLGEDGYATFDPACAVALPPELVPARWREITGSRPR